MFASFLAGGCAGRIADADSEQALRMRLQAAHDDTLRLELHGRLDAAAIARGVHEVQAWCDESSGVVTGSVDAQGTVSIALPAIEAHDRGSTPILHVVDKAGAHWYCWLDLANAPPAGRHDLGELHLQREPDALSVVDDRGQPLAGALVLLYQRYPEEHRGFAGPRPFETCTDERGKAHLCRAAPFDVDARLVVRHEDFAPRWGPLTPSVEIDHGGEIRGRVVVPTGADPADFAVGVWVDEASPQHIRGDSVYANVTAQLAPDGSYRLRNVPPGRRTVQVQDRHSIDSRGSSADVGVGSEPTTAPDLTIDPGVQPSVAMRMRLTGHDGQAVLASQATIHISDVGISVPLHDGYVDWVGDPSEPFAIDVAGYGITSRSPHRSGDVFRLQGGYRVALRLAIDAARRLPPRCALRATVTPISDHETWFGREPALYLDRNWDQDNETPLGIARDPPIVVDSTGRYQIDLEMIRWDSTEGKFVHEPIDVEPREFEVRTDTESTLVTVSSRFVETPR